jgi:hypothetical protein
MPGSANKRNLPRVKWWVPGMHWLMGRWEAWPNCCGPRKVLNTDHTGWWEGEGVWPKWCGPSCFLEVLLLTFFFSWDRVSLYSPGCPGTHFVDQAGLKLRNPPASASWVLGLKVCATTPGSASYFLIAEYREGRRMWALVRCGEEMNRWALSRNGALSSECRDAQCIFSLFSQVSFERFILSPQST